MRNFRAIFLTAVIVCAHNVRGASDLMLALVSESDDTRQPSSAASSSQPGMFPSCGIYGNLDPRTEDDTSVLDSIQWIQEQTFQKKSQPQLQDCLLAFKTIHTSEQGRKVIIPVASGLFKERPMYISDVWMNFNGGRFWFTTLFGGLLPLSVGLAYKVDFKKIAGGLAFFGCLAIAGGVYLRQKSLDKRALLPVFIDAANHQQLVLGAAQFSATAKNPMGFDGFACIPMKNIATSNESMIAGVMQDNTKMYHHVNTLLNSGGIDDKGHWVMRELDAHVKAHRDSWNQDSLRYDRPCSRFLIDYQKGWRNLEDDARARLVREQRYKAAGWMMGGLVPLALAGILVKCGGMPVPVSLPN